MKEYQLISLGFNCISITFCVLALILMRKVRKYSKLMAASEQKLANDAFKLMGMLRQQAEVTLQLKAQLKKTNDMLINTLDTSVYMGDKEIAALLEENEKMLQ